MKELKNKLPEVCEIVETNILDTVEEIKQHGRQINPEIGEHLDNLLHSAKSLVVIKRELGEEGEDGGEYGRGGYRDGGGYGQRRSSVTGRYMDGYADGGYGAYNDGGYGRMYRDDGKEQVREHLRQAMQSAPDQATRRALEEAMRKF